MAEPSLLPEKERDCTNYQIKETGYASLSHAEPDGSSSITYQIEGAHCAACIQKIESRLLREVDVDSARLNFSTGRLAVKWNGTSNRANDFAEAVSALGYGVKPYNIDMAQQDSREEEKLLLFCLGLSGFAAGNMMTLSVVLWSSTPVILGMATEDFIHWVAAAIALPTVLIAGRPFFRSAFKALKSGHTNMDVPISLGVTLACLISLSETIRHGAHVYYDSAVMLIFFLLIGRYLDCRTRRSARSTATDLLEMMSGFATVLEDNGSISRLPIRKLRENMLVSVAVGEKFPVDGRIETGATDIDTSLVTGETLPRSAPAGSNVYGGTINLSAPVIICVEKAAENSLLSDIVRLMEKAGQGQARYVRLAEKAAKLYTPVVHTMALLTFLLWWLILGSAWQPALMVAVTVLIITCPCALGLAVPVVQVLATGQLMKSGILVKSGDALERLSTITSVILDKTGTLTIGRPQLQNIAELSPSTLALASALAMHSRHPLCKTLTEMVLTEKKPELSDVIEHPGQGMEALWNDKTVRLGSRKWCGSTEDMQGEGRMELWLAVGSQAPVPFYFNDMLRYDARETVAKLKKTGLNVTLLSGDRETVVENVAAQSGITNWLGEATPVEKYNFLERQKQGGQRILMVGDGLNDAPVMAAADISMSPSTAIDMAQNVADIIFMGNGISPVFTAWRYAVFAQKLVKQNFILAVIYNVIAIPLAVAGFVTPLVAAIAMSGSSLLVIANSFRLRGMK